MTAPLPLPATPEAYAMGCTCFWTPPTPARIVVAFDCPLHSESARAARDEDRAQPARLSGGAT